MFPALVGFVCISSYFHHCFRQQQKRARTVRLVALTGGPCGGKSTSVNHLSAALQEEGYTVFVLPELPTILMNSGYSYPGFDSGKDLKAFELNVIKLQLSFESMYRNMAESFLISKSNGCGNKCKGGVIICDRGVVDIRAYVPEDMWEEIISEIGEENGSLLHRYSAVIHLVTAADGAVSFYGNATNSIRTETVEEAIALDRRSQECWEKHNRRSVIDNSTTFANKLKRASDFVLASL